MVNGKLHIWVEMCSKIAQIVLYCPYFAQNRSFSGIIGYILAKILKIGLIVYQPKFALIVPLLAVIELFVDNNRCWAMELELTYATLCATFDAPKVADKLEY